MNYKNMGPDAREVRPPHAAAALPDTPLARQSSVYSLTFDEFQNTMGSFGKDFGSMNMDEFLKSIWTAEESQAMASVLGGCTDPGGGVGAGPGPGPGPGLQRQGSLTLPRTLSQKTVDEVWRDLLGVPGTGGADFQLQQQQPQQRQPTLGEMTLEEFLVRAGVVREDINQTAPPLMVNNGNVNSSNHNSSVFYGELPAPNSHHGLALGFPQPGLSDGTIVPNPLPNNSPTNLAMTARPYAAPLPLGDAADLASPQGMRGGGLMRIGDPAMNNELMPGVVGLGGARLAVTTVGSPPNRISTDGFAKDNGDLSSLSPVPYVFNGGLRGRKRSGTVEKVVERRQRRMIKNRESAARSRARKQAYTMELEAEVAKLKEQNEELHKKQAENAELKKNQVLEMINQQRGPKKRCLRRTQTGPW